MFSVSYTRINTNTMQDPYFLGCHGCVNSICKERMVEMFRRNIRKYWKNDLLALE